jgi:hypothetical protein
LATFTGTAAPIVIEKKVEKTIRIKDKIFIAIGELEVK